MKFWQLVSLLRSHSDVLKSVLNDTRWNVYAEWFSKFEEIVQMQDREKLDAVVPDELALAALEKIDTLLFCSEQAITSYPQHGSDQPIPIKDAYQKFGANVIEEVFERGSVNLQS